jgi:hypothetical protein
MPKELCTKELLVTSSEETLKFKKLRVFAALVKYFIGPSRDVNRAGI